VEEAVAPGCSRRRGGGNRREFGEEEEAAVVSSSSLEKRVEFSFLQDGKGKKRKVYGLRWSPRAAGAPRLFFFNL
jgi:hypothetical protein